jgi:hypothetical protein
VAVAEHVHVVDDDDDDEVPTALVVETVLGPRCSDPRGGILAGEPAGGWRAHGLGGVV